MRKFNTKPTFIVTLMTALLCYYASGQEINYQGRLTENGSPVSKVATIQINVFSGSDLETVVYQENVGDVEINNGLYSFQFGANGQSYVPFEKTTIVASPDRSVFDYVHSNEFLEETVVIKSQDSVWQNGEGASGGRNLTGLVDSAANKISAIFLNGNQAVGSEIIFSFLEKQTGISGVIARLDDLYLEVVIDGISISTQSFAYSPYAIYAKNASTAEVAETVNNLPDNFQDELIYLKKISEAALKQSLGYSIDNTDHEESSDVKSIFFNENLNSDISNPYDSNIQEKELNSNYSFFEKGKQYGNKVIKHVYYPAHLQREARDYSINDSVRFLKFYLRWDGTYYGGFHYIYYVSAKIIYADGSEDVFSDEGELRPDKLSSASSSSGAGKELYFTNLYPEKEVARIETSTEMTRIGQGRSTQQYIDFQIWLNGATVVKSNAIGDFFAQTGKYRYSPVFSEREQSLPYNVFLQHKTSGERFELRESWVELPGLSSDFELFFSTDPDNGINDPDIKNIIQGIILVRSL